MKTMVAGLSGLLLVLAMGCDGGTTPGLASTDLPGTGPDVVGTDTESPGTDTSLPEGAICRPGEAKCMGSIFLVCNVDGSDWISVACTGGQACTPTGCKGTPGQDVIVGTDESPADTPPPPEDTIEPPTDTGTPKDVPVLTDTILPNDPGPTDPGQPADTVTDANCGNNPPCAANRECCNTPMGLRCVPAGQCPTTQGCQTAQDCPPGQECCPGAYPGAPSECAASCGGGTLPTCTSDTDCTGGQTCFSIYGNTSYCLSVCETDGDCNGQTCEDVGAFGYSLGKVCNCAQDTDCGEGLSCCEIPYVGQWLDVRTCLTQCM